MTDAIVPLPGAVRMSDADYPGVVRQFGPDWRLVVSSDGKRYTLQQRVPTDAGAAWVSAGGKSPSTLDRIAAKYAAQVDGLAALCARLHPDPAAGLPQFVAAVRARDAAFQARDVRRSDYARVVARDGQIRLSVDPDGLFYLLQWVKGAYADDPSIMWKLLLSASSLSEIRDYILENVFQPTGSGPANRKNGEALLPRVETFLNGLPESPDEGSWLPVPAVP
jgi:hypothetical protein